ncbi:hypothetical protein BJ912DRAFT_984421 [Pholiota molesta]|nr:hypothetical protein BJ912DRAFT_984421 [Pholiota molesta]
MSESSQPKIKYKRSQKRIEVDRIKGGIARKLENVRADPIIDARVYGIQELDPYDGEVSKMEKSLELVRYWANLGKKPSTAEIKKLDGDVEDVYGQYQTKSQAGQEANPWFGRKIKERYTPSPAFDPGSSRGGSFPSLSDVSLTESSFMREPTPQPMPAALPPPPRYPGSTSRGTVGSHSTYAEQPVASSSRYTPPGRYPHVGQPKNFLDFEDGISEESASISEDKGHRPL